MNLDYDKLGRAAVDLLSGLDARSNGAANVAAASQVYATLAVAAAIERLARSLPPFPHHHMVHRPVQGAV